MPFVNPLYLRCASCHGYLAGPLTQFVELPELQLAANIGRPVIPPSAVYWGEDWALLHPRWCASWSSSSGEESNDEEVLNMAPGAPRLTTERFGCCGPYGEVRCPAGHLVGEVQGDCGQEQWLKLHFIRLQRSDEVDDAWELYDQTLQARLKMCGRIVNGLREGEWLVYEEIAKPAVVHQKGPDPRGRWLIGMERVLTLELLRVERYEQGQRVEST